MKILVFADSHGAVDFMLEAIALHKNNVDLIIHLGNNASDTSAFQAVCGHIASITIIGNYDFPYKDAKSEHTFMPTGTNVKIFACHGHKHNVKKGLDDLYDAALFNNAKIVLFAHTHIAHISQNNGVFFINPGSCSIPRGGEPASYAVINIENNEVFPSIIYKKQ